MSAHQSELFAEALREARTDYVTKSDLNAAIAELKSEIAETKFHMLWGLAIVVAVQIVAHFWQ